MNRKPNMLFAAFLLSVCLLTGCGAANTSEVQSSAQPAAQSTQADSGNINIPGYESLDFKAGETAQTTRFHNPPENTCYFRLTLTLDGEDLWQSGYIAPGETAYDITLSRPLEKGEYQAKLKYECFTLQDKSPLNGMDLDLAINVK